MKLVIGGSIAIILSIFGFAYFFTAFFKFLAGSLPVMFLLGGGLALYLYREMRCDDGEAPDGCCDTTDTGQPLSSETPEGEIQVPEKKMSAGRPDSVASPEDPAPSDEPEPAESESSTETPAQAESNDSNARETVVEPGTPGAGKDPAPPVAGAPAYIGNTDSMVFHTPTCKFSNSKKCTASFATTDEALAAGYKACGVCKPAG